MNRTEIYIHTQERSQQQHSGASGITKEEWNARERERGRGESGSPFVPQEKDGPTGCAGRATERNVLIEGQRGENI